jgi:hypothetical protein
MSELLNYKRNQGRKSKSGFLLFPGRHSIENQRLNCWRVSAVFPVLAANLHDAGQHRFPGSASSSSEPDGLAARLCANQLSNATKKRIITRQAEPLLLTNATEMGAMNGE